MNFEPTHTQQLVRDMVRTFAEKEVRPQAAAIDRADVFPRELYLRLAALGVLGMTLPAEYGGSGADTVSWATRRGGAGAHVPGPRGCAARRQADQRRHPVQRHRRAARPAHSRHRARREDLRDRADGAGRWLRCRRRADAGAADRGRLGPERHQRFITLALVCDLAVVVATTDPAKRHDGIALFLVEAGMPGFRHGAKDPVMGLRGLATGEIILDDCHVPPSALLAPPGQGFKSAMRSLTSGGSASGPRRSGSRRRRWKRRSPTRASARPSGSPSPASRPSSSCWPIRRRRSKRPGS